MIWSFLKYMTVMHEILLKFVPHCLPLFVTALLFILSWTICFNYLWFQWRYLVYNIRRPDWSQDCFQMHQIYHEMSYSASLTKLITCANWTEGQLALIQGNLSIMTLLFLCLKAYWDNFYLIILRASNHQLVDRKNSYEVS